MRHGFLAALCSASIASLLVLTGCGGSSGGTQPPPTQVRFVSSAPAQASEGTAYSYPIQANVSGATFALTAGPTGASISGSTLTWTPSAQQSRAENKFTVTASYQGTSAVQTWSVTPTGYIRGTTKDTCTSDDGQTTLVGTIGNSPVKVLVPNSTGGFDTYSSTIATDGTFSIPNVPAGSFWLIALYTNLWTDRSSIDLGWRNWGGCVFEAPSSAGTSLQGSVAGLNPWQNYDDFYFAVPNARTGKGALTTVGATSLDFTIPFGNLLLLNSANGDNGYFAQLVTSNYGGQEFQILERFSGPQPVTVQDGAVTSLTTTLQSVPQTSSFRGSFRGSQFAALHDVMFPGSASVAAGDGISIAVTADTASPQSLGTYLVLASHQLTTDQDFGDISFGNPYPAAWTPFLDYHDFAVYPIQPAGAGNAVSIPLVNRVVRAQLPTVASPVVPLIGPAQNPQIDGKNLFQNQTITVPNPVFSWQPPALGSASGYRIRVNEVVVNGGVASLDFKGGFYVSGTAVQLPPGVLQSGKSYQFTIDTLYRTSDFAARPNVETFPEGESDLGSGIITMQ